MKAGVAAAVVAVLLAAGCSGGYEQALVGQFFTASRLLDRTALADIATVIFDPRTDGTVLRFDVVDRIAPEDRGQKRVIVTATVHLPSGRIVPETLMLTLRRADTPAGEGRARWVVISVVNAR